MKNASDLINQIRSARTPEELRAAQQAKQAFLREETTTPAEAEAVRQAASESLNNLLDEHEIEQQQALRYLALNGKRYDLNDWLTPVEYARRYGLRSANNVTNWMMRGIIPPQDIIDVPELNGLRLVRNRSYKMPSFSDTH